VSGDNSIDRRQLLKTIAVGGAMVRWPALAAASTAADNAKHTYAVFSAAQAALMDALVEVLIPADDFPGAKDAGVVTYIDKKLGGPYGSFFIARYETGLKQVEEISRQRFHQDFASLDGSQQSTLLHAFADKTYGADIQDFFHAVLSDTFEGYYGNPEDGGNRNGASWKMIGFRG
jgi:gluconate 2-dehydrogenase gamma chain